MKLFTVLKFIRNPVTLELKNGSSVSGKITECDVRHGCEIDMENVTYKMKKMRDGDALILARFRVRGNMMKCAILDDNEDIRAAYKKAEIFENDRKNNKQDAATFEKRVNSGRGRGTTRNVYREGNRGGRGGRGRGRGGRGGGRGRGRGGGRGGRDGGRDRGGSRDQSRGRDDRNSDRKYERRDRRDSYRDDRGDRTRRDSYGGRDRRDDSRRRDDRRR